MALIQRLAIDPKKPLLLTFDAFGTLYKPRSAIGSLYAACARQNGLKGFSDSVIQESFFKGMCYGWPVLYVASLFP